MKPCPACGLTSQDFFHLRLILEQLRELKTKREHSVGNEVLDDNIDWLDCFLAAQELS